MGSLAHRLSRYETASLAHVGGLCDLTLFARWDAQARHLWRGETALVVQLPLSVTIFAVEFANHGSQAQACIPEAAASVTKGASVSTNAQAAKMGNQLTTRNLWMAELALLTLL